MCKRDREVERGCGEGQGKGEVGRGKVVGEGRVRAYGKKQQHENAQKCRHVISICRQVRRAEAWKGCGRR